MAEAAYAAGPALSGILRGPALSLKNKSKQQNGKNVSLNDIFCDTKSKSREATTPHTDMRHAADV